MWEHLLQWNCTFQTQTVRACGVYRTCTFKAWYNDAKADCTQVNVDTIKHTDWTSSSLRVAKLLPPPSSTATLDPAPPHKKSLTMYKFNTSMTCVMSMRSETSSLSQTHIHTYTIHRCTHTHTHTHYMYTSPLTHITLTGTSLAMMSSSSSLRFSALVTFSSSHTSSHLVCIAIASLCSCEMRSTSLLMPASSCRGGNY